MLVTTTVVSKKQPVVPALRSSTLLPSLAFQRTCMSCVEIDILYKVFARRTVLWNDGTDCRLWVCASCSSRLAPAWHLRCPFRCALANVAGDIYCPKSTWLKAMTIPGYVLESTSSTIPLNTVWQVSALECDCLVRVANDGHLRRVSRTYSISQWSATDLPNGETGHLERVQRPELVKVQKGTVTVSVNLEEAEGSLRSSTVQ